MHITVRLRSELTDAERSALGTLNGAVYPPDAVANWPGRVIQWSRPQWSVMVWSDDDTQVLAHAGIVVRDGRLNDRDIKIGGIGGVMTHPEFRHQGYATTAIARCVQFFRDQGDIDIGLLVCESRLLPFYSHLGWQPFPGTMLTEQAGQSVPFVFNLPMTFPIRIADELTGTIDLLGPPW
jgi:GNAT superfamily N-acetyltransferase